MPAESQLRQLVLAAPEHVRQRASQAWQTPLLENLPRGVHEATQLLPSIKGAAPAQPVQLPSRSQV